VIFRYFGGWVAPNIYYLGESNIINVRKGNVNLKLGGSSGIFKIFDFNNPKLEKFPFA
jgi:lariat debranching enzyme